MSGLHFLLGQTVVSRQCLISKKPHSIRTTERVAPLSTMKAYCNLHQRHVLVVHDQRFAVAHQRTAPIQNQHYKSGGFLTKSCKGYASEERLGDRVRTITVES